MLGKAMIEEKPETWRYEGVESAGHFSRWIQIDANG
jgi:hypothetical protein